MPNFTTSMKHFHLYKDKLISIQRFVWWFKLLLLVPTILWFAEFNLSKYIPNDARPVVDTTTLPYLDSRILFGHTLLHFPRNKLEDEPSKHGLVVFLDLLSAFVYIIHFCFAWIYAVGLYFYFRKRVDASGKPIITPWSFFWCLGLLNFVAVSVQLIWPTAPPWYVELYGTKPPHYGMAGSPAGLANADSILHLKLFASLYGKSPIVFGSFPSLHGAWPIMIAIFSPPGKGFKIAGIVYVSLVWWAAMYLNHHFLVDLLGGLFFVIICYLGGMVALQYFLAYFKDRVYYSSGKINTSRQVRYSDTQDLELIVVQDRLEGSASDEESLGRSPKISVLNRTPSRDDNSVLPLLILDNDNTNITSFSKAIDNSFKNEKHL